VSPLPGELIERLATIRSVGAITGAGVSAESGIQTYRGEGGLYDDPDEGDRTIEALSGSTLERDPDVTWRTVAVLARRAAAAAPNAAHAALVELEGRAERFVLLTQNVDGLHQRAGSINVIEIHGHVFDTVCSGCGEIGRLDRGQLERLVRAPRCDDCGQVRRPDVVLFGEMLAPDKIDRIRAEFHVAPPELILVIGTTALFPYIVEPVLLARATGGLTVEINPEETVLTRHVGYSIRATAGAVLPEIAGAIGAGH